MIGWAEEMLVETTLVVAAVMVLRWPARYLFGAKAAYLLWIAPALFIVLSVIPVPVPAPDLRIDILSGAAEAGPTQPAPEWTTQLAEFLFAVWITGAAAFLWVQVWRYRSFLADALAAARPLSIPNIDDAAIIETGAVSGPSAAGLLTRRVFIPAGFAESYSEEERALALRHEILHHRRGDLWASAAALGFLSLHWWNPIAHLAHRAFRSDLEAACDADVIADEPAEGRGTYAKTILRCAVQRMPQPTCALTNLSELKGRLFMLSLKHSPLRRALGTVLCAAFAGGTLLFALPAEAQDPKAEESQQVYEKHEIRRIVKDGKVFEESKIPGEIQARMDNCDAEKFELDTGGAESKSRTRIVMCAKPGATKAETAKMLEEALGRIEGTSEMPAEHKAQIVARIKARIAELRAGS